MYLEEVSEELKKRFQQAVREAASDDEAYRGILRLFREWLTFPLNGTVAGTPLAVSDIRYDGNPRSGLVAETVRRNRHCALSLLGVDFPETDLASTLIAAYRHWAGWGSAAPAGGAEPRRKEPPAAAAPGQEVELVVYAIRRRTAVGRLTASDEEAILHLSGRDLLDLVPGETLRLAVRKAWRYGRHLHLSARLLSHRFDLPRLGLKPLRLYEQDQWDPGQVFEWWPDQEAAEPIPDWYVPIVAAGARPSYQMEQVIPGMSALDDDDPILQSVELREMGDWVSARAVLMKLLAEDLRCLDAYAHLGNLEIDGNTQKALRCYEAGLGIGSLSLSQGFNGVLPWNHIDNRPHLRCLHGYGLCLWRLERFPEAEEAFERLLWLDPSDSLGARFLIPQVRAMTPWSPDL